MRLNSQRRHALNFFVRCKSIMLHNVNILTSCVVPQNWHKICCDLSKSALIVYIFHKSMSRVPFLLEAAWYRLSTFEDKSKFSNEIFCRKKIFQFFALEHWKKQGNICLFVTMKGVSLSHDVPISFRELIMFTLFVRQFDLQVTYSNDKNTHNHDRNVFILLKKSFGLRVYI